MRRPRPLPPDLRDLPFSRRAALDRGLSDRRLRATDLSRPFHGVRLADDLPTNIEWKCRAYQERMAPDAAFSHGTAARLYGLPLPLYARDAEVLHVTIPAHSRPPEGRGVTGHELDRTIWDARDLVYQDPERAQLFALTTVTPAVLWAQLSRTLDTDDLVALGDAIVGTRPPLASIDDLRTIVRRWGGRRGARSMVEAVELVRVGSLSRPESLQRLQLVRAGIPEPALNIRVEDRSGKLISMADLSWPDFRVLLEYEGDGHRTSRGKFLSDMTRGENYADGDWFPMRSHAGYVFGDPNELTRRVARRLGERGWRPPGELRHVAAARR